MGRPLQVAAHRLQRRLQRVAPSQAIYWAWLGASELLALPPVTRGVRSIARSHGNIQACESMFWRVDAAWSDERGGLSGAAARVSWLVRVRYKGCHEEDL